MAVLIRWQFDSCNYVPAEGYDKWWIDMHIDGQLQCEEALSFTGKGDSCVVVDNKKRYQVDLVRMTQRNLETGRIRPIRRTTTANFSTETHYFKNGCLKRVQPAETPAESKCQKFRKQGNK